MKITKVIAGACLLLFLFSVITFAAEDTSTQSNFGPLRKLGRGIQNATIGGPFQLGKDIEDTYWEDGAVAAATFGAAKGVVKGVFRFCVGLYESFTFIIPGPENYKPIMNDPEFFLGQKQDE